MHYQILNINENLRLILSELEVYFGIELNKAEIEQVFEDAQNDLVSYKTYIFYKASNFFFPDWEISGAVEEYEPETLFLKSSGGFGKKKEFDYFFANRLEGFQQ